MLECDRGLQLLQRLQVCPVPTPPPARERNLPAHQDRLVGRRSLDAGEEGIECSGCTLQLTTAHQVAGLPNDAVFARREHAVDDLLRSCGEVSVAAEPVDHAVDV